MKKSKFTKALLLVLSFALVIGAMVGFSVSAQDTEADILAHNIVYGEKVSIAYAVNVSLDSADTVKVAYYWDNDKDNVKNATLLDTSVPENTATIDGKAYPVFVTAGLPAKELGKVAHATVYTGDAPAENAKWTSYSAVEYLYVRLYVDGFADKTEADGKDFNRKNLYQSLLSYGANAQAVFDYNADKLVTDYDIAYTDNDKVTLNGASYAFGFDLNVVAEYSGDGYVEKWTVTDANGLAKETEIGEFEINGACKVVPTIGTHTCKDEDNDHICDSCKETVSECKNENATEDHLCDICGKVVALCADATEDGKCDVCKLYSFEYTVKNAVTLYTLDNLTNKNLVKQDTITTEDTTASYYGYAGQLITDPTNAANKVLQVLVNDGKNNSKTTSGVNNVSNIKLTPDVINEGGKIHVIEFDFNLMHFQRQSGTTINDPFSFYAYDKNGNKLGELQNYSSTSKWAGFLCLDSITNESDPDLENNYHFGNNEQRTDETEPSSFAMFDAQRWYRFRFIWNEETNALYFDVSFDDGKTWYIAFNGNRAIQGFDGEAAYVQLEFQQCYQMAFNFLFDDMSYTIVDTLPTRPEVIGNDKVEFPSGR